MAPRKRAKASAASTPLADSQPKTPVDTTVTATSPQSVQSPEDIVNDPWTDDQESVLFKNLIRYKPTGIHKHFRMLSIAADLRSQGYHAPHTRPSGIWTKLSLLYDLDTLDERENVHTFGTRPESPVSPDVNDDADKLPGFELPDDEFGDMMWARRFLASDAEKSSSPEIPELQFGRHDPRPVSLGSVSVGSEEKEEVEVQSSPPARGRGRTGRRGKGRATPAGRNSKAQSAVSDSVGDEEEEGEGEDEEEESEEENTKGGQRATKGRTTRRTRER